MSTRKSLLAGLIGLAFLLVIGLAQSGGGARVARAQEEGGFYTVTVRAGETLATYARLYGVSGVAIIAANNLRDGNLIFPGQRLVIPVVRTFTPSLTTPFLYTAQPGDTLLSVAERFEQDPATVARVNGVAELTPGQTYFMPAGPHLYRLRPGDTIGTVAARYGVTESFILSANNIPNPGVLYAGQQIFIPTIFDTRPIPITEPPAPSITPTPTPTTVSPTGFIQVVVQPGDSLVTFVNRYKVSASAIIAANPQIQANPALIFPGQVLLIPVAAAPTPAPTATPAPGVTATPPTGFIQITAKPGDSLVTYVQTYKVSASAIIAVNPLIAANPGLIFVGQVITIPLTAGFTTPSPTPTFPPAQTVEPTGTPAPTSTPAAGNFFTVQVRAGESLTTYTLRYGVTGASLLAVNPKLRENPGLIFPGQTLIIPVPVSYTPSRTTPFLYTVGAGESAATVALKFEMTVDTLTRANPGVAITPGATILVPAGPRVYTVKQGDELRTIAAQFGTTVEFLLTGNSLPNPDRIYIGQQIFIPVQYNAKPIPYN